MRQILLSLDRKQLMRDKSSVYIIITTLFLVFSILLVLQYRHTRARAPITEIVNSKSTSGPKAVQFLKKGTYPSFASGVMEPGTIRLELSPEGFDNRQLRVRFFANAHDLILDPYNLAQMTTLEYGSRQIKPSAYSDRMKGHHDSGLMFFDIGKLHNPTALSTFTITVRGLPSEEVRVFTW